MAQTIVVKVKVEELTRYGFKANGKYVNFSKQLPEADKMAVVSGAEFEAEYYVADSGKEYLNKILSRTTPTPAVKQNVASTPTNNPKHEQKAESKKEYKAKEDTSMTKDEWASKDRRISRQGCIQVAVQVTGDWDGATALADKMLKYVNL
jgi:hypothetical protein